MAVTCRLPRGVIAYTAHPFLIYVLGYLPLEHLDRGTPSLGWDTTHQDPDCYCYNVYN